jgi:hypothetical protein
MRVCGSRPHLGCNPDGFHELLFSGALLQGGPGMSADAIRALRYMGHCNGDQLFG